MPIEEIVDPEVIADIDPALVAIMDNVVADMQEASIVEGTIGDAILVTGLGADDETQGVLIPWETATSGALTNGDFVVDVVLPVQVGLTFEGPDELVTGTEAFNFFNDLINQTFIGISDPTLISLGLSLSRAIDAVTDPTDVDSVIRLVHVLDNSTEATEGDILIMGSADTNELIALNIAPVSATNTIVLENVDRVVVAGAGTIEASGENGAMVVGDNRSQILIGGDGDDTLTGGGGTDTITGGAGSDIFGVNGRGNLTVTDFGEGDLMSFSIPNVANLAALKTLITSVSFADGNTVATFVEGSTITLVGVTEAELTADMFTFTA